MCIFLLEKSESLPATLPGSRRGLSGLGAVTGTWVDGSRRREEHREEHPVKGLIRGLWQPGGPATWPWGSLSQALSFLPRPLFPLAFRACSPRTPFLCYSFLLSAAFFLFLGFWRTLICVDYLQCAGLTLKVLPKLSEKWGLDGLSNFCRFHGW